VSSAAPQNAGSAANEAARPGRISWIYPDRSTHRWRQMEHEGVWDAYAEVAADLGLAFSLDMPEDFSVDATNARDPKVYVRGERVTPQDTIFVTSLYSLPHQVQDVCNQIFAFSILEAAGFYLPVPPQLSYIGEDKAATMIHLSESPTPLLPTVRIGAGREAMTGHYDAALASLAYPIILKPAYWGMGLGVLTVNNIHDLRGAISLAAGSDTAMVAQPFLDVKIERRAYVVNGTTVHALYGSKEGYCLMASRKEGGIRRRGFSDLPPELESTVEYVASRLPTPYFTLDFIFDGDQYWVTEIELDGAAGFGGSPADDAIARDIVHARFSAYLAGHAAWLEQRSAKAI
jgi:hypothetical protein